MPAPLKLTTNCDSAADQQLMIMLICIDPAQ
jgi:hypothetical protein